MTPPREDWLPKNADQLTALFGRDVFKNAAAGPTPLLAGAQLMAGQPKSSGEAAWHEALSWLKEFRQGTSGARQPGNGNRPSISNWPEADKIRRLAGKTKAHPPRYNSDPAWPRAGFGLPIVGRFQKQPRNRGAASYDEPGDFQLQWHGNDGLHDRLASPLILKAMALADGKFAPIALWLNRAAPPGVAVLVMNKSEVAHSAAPFARMLGTGDQARFEPLTSPDLRTAFFCWLEKRFGGGQ